MPLASTIELPERYRVARHIASGGMASVWEAEDLLLGRVVAVKVLGAQYAADPAARARFQREARTAAQVSDQTNVVTIFDIGEHGSDAFIVMEHFAGGTVADRLRDARDARRRIPRETALRWLREAAAGLDVAHAAGIVHRDVKPANLLLDAQGRLAVGDFGIARLADDTQMTKTGQVLGTAAYISPEQALGRPASPASDRYALAVVAFELLTGVRPFAGGPPTAQALQHATGAPLRASAVAPELPAAIDGVFASALAKDPASRPRSASDLVSRLERALGARPQPAPTLAVAVARQGTTRRGSASPRIAIIGIVAVLAGAGVALLLLGAHGDGDRDAASTEQRSPAVKAAASQAAAKQASTPATTTTATPAQAGLATAADSHDPTVLGDRGFALSQAGDYAAALPFLRGSVDGYRSAGRTKELDYAYALFNYAVALSRSGDPASAIPLLRERLTFDNQRGVVRKELAAAQARMAGGGATPGQSAEPGNGAKPGKGAKLGKRAKPGRGNRDGE